MLCFSVLLPCSLHQFLSLSLFGSHLPAFSLLTGQLLVKSTIDWDTTTRSSPTLPAGHHPGPNTATGTRGSPQVAQGKESACNAREAGHAGSVPGSGRSRAGKIPCPAVQEEHQARPGARPPMCSPTPQRKIPELREVREHPRDTQHTWLTHTLSPWLAPAGLGFGPQPFACPGGDRGEGHRAEMLGRGGNGSPL